MPQLVNQRDFIFPAKGIEGQLHIKASVLTDGNRVGACHGLAKAEDGIASSLLFPYRAARHNHGRETVLVGLGISFALVNIRFIALNALLQRSDSLGELLQDLILQRILAARSSFSPWSTPALISSASVDSASERMCQHFENTHRSYSPSISGKRKEHQRYFYQVGWSFYYPCPSPADAPASIRPWLALTNPLYSPFPGHFSSLSSCHVHSSSCSKSFGEPIRYSIFEETVKFGKNAPA